MSDILILGDINVDLSAKNNSNTKKYLSVLKSLGLTQLVNDFTSVTNTSATIIDHILTNREELYHEGFTLDLGISDHSLICTHRKKQKLPRDWSYINCRSYRKFNDTDFQSDIDAVNWQPIFNCMNVNEAANLFQTMLMNIVDKHAPVIRLKLRHHAPGWFNHDFLSHVDERKF